MVYQEPKTLPTNKAARKNFQKKSLRGRTRQELRRRIAGQVHCLSNETNCLDLQDGCPKFSVCSLASLLSQKTKYQKLKIYKQQAMYDKNVCG